MGARPRELTRAIEIGDDAVVGVGGIDGEMECAGYLLKSG
jgi:hypothetical protein